MAVAASSFELAARVDLALGVPDEPLASVALVEVKSGVRRPEHRADLHFSALVEALRHPAPPFAVATYYARTGQLDVEPVGQQMLNDAVERTVAGARRLRDEQAGLSAPPTVGMCLLCRPGPTRPVSSRSAGGGTKRANRAPQERAGVGR